MGEMKVTLTLHDARTDRPEKSMQVIGWKYYGPKTERWWDTHYSKRNDAFNCGDESEDVRNAFEIDYWAEHPDMDAILHGMTPAPEPADICADQMHDEAMHEPDESVTHMRKYSIDSEEPNYAEMD